MDLFSVSSAALSSSPGCSEGGDFVDASVSLSAVETAGDAGFTLTGTGVEVAVGSDRILALAGVLTSSCGIGSSRPGGSGGGEGAEGGASTGMGGGGGG